MNHITIKIEDEKVSIVNGNRRLKALLQLDGKAIVRDIESGQDVTVILNGNNELIKLPHIANKIASKRPMRFIKK